jgi:hypothetical protein
VSKGRAEEEREEEKRKKKEMEENLTTNRNEGIFVFYKGIGKVKILEAR